MGEKRQVPHFIDRLLTLKFPCDLVCIEFAVGHMIESWYGPVFLPLLRHDVLDRQVAFDGDNLALVGPLQVLDRLENVPQTRLAIRLVLVTSHPSRFPVCIAWPTHRVRLTRRQQFMEPR